MTGEQRAGAQRPDADLQDILSAVMVVAQGLDLPATVRRIVTSAMALVDARYGAVGVSNDDGSLQEFIYVGVDAETAALIGDPPCGRGLLGYLLEVQQPVRVAELSEHPSSVGFPPNHPPMHSFLGAPIIVGGNLFGCIYLAEKADGIAFTASDAKAIEIFAAATAVAIDNAQMHAEALQQQQRLGELQVIEERERIGRDLHDHVIQRIFAAGLGLQVARSAARDEPVRDRLDSVIGELDRTIADIRSTIFELSAGGSGLRTRLVRAVRAVAHGGELSVDVGFSGPVESAVADDGLARDLEAVVTESVSNAVRHSGGTRVAVTVLASSDSVTVEVADDGTGVPDGGRRSGLRNLATRAELRGGTVELLPANAEAERPGTVVRWSVPREP
ncbi:MULTISPECIES: GAF domain-containing sensor histidine kinase [Tsukamurella]|uniref:GAF domain-containing protein n=1 Tax=Tsukamurella columbiensis TaxID=128509 RepID=A0ABX1LCJ8_9ACTN|nr:MULTISPECIES: GAF domain-containing protein [Tsukamurella]NMD55907.1 GAF domain-containing protein [Tsukamurella columbiensis]